MIIVKQGIFYSIVGISVNEPNGVGKPYHKYSIMNNFTKKIHKQQYWSSTGFIEDKFYKMESKFNKKIFDCKNCKYRIL